MDGVCVTMILASRDYWINEIMANCTASSGEYLVSALTPDELESWFDFLAAAFAEKGTPREYFVRHVTTDPWFNISAIFVAKREGRICSTTRVFHRKIFMDGHVVSVAGIGEVSTAPSLRRTGLSSKILDVVTKYMVEKGYPLSLLHSSQSPIQGIYQRRDWFSVPIGYGSYDVNMSAVSQLVKNSRIECIRIDLKEREHLQAVMALYSNAAACLHGLIVRDDEQYWNRWIYDEYSHRRCVCYALNGEHNKEASPSRISAYLIACQTAGGGIEVLEYLYSKHQLSADITPKQAFVIVLHQTVTALKSGGCSDGVMSVTCPLAFVPQDWLQDPVYGRVNEISVDMGWMYRVMDGSQKRTLLMSLEDCSRDTSYKTHVFSKLDSF